MASELQTVAGRGWIGVDLDGTLAYYRGYRGPSFIGPPVPRMLSRVKAWLREGRSTPGGIVRDIRIFTARVAPEGHSAAELNEARQAIEAWCERHLGVTLPVTCVKDMYCVEIWDDRSVQVVHNTGHRVDNLEFWPDAGVNPKVRQASSGGPGGPGGPGGKAHGPRVAPLVGRNPGAPGPG